MDLHRIQTDDLVVEADHIIIAVGATPVIPNDCVDLVTEAAELAGIYLIHRIRLTLPPAVKILWKTLPLWTDPQYRILEYSTPDLLEMDLRHLVRFGIGSDATQWYRASSLAAPKSKDKGKRGARAEDRR